jgi:hypothetical protein
MEYGPKLKRLEIAMAMAKFINYSMNSNKGQSMQFYRGIIMSSLITTSKIFQ